MARPRTFKRTPYAKVSRSRGKMVDYARSRVPMVWTPSSTPGGVSRGRRRMNARIGGYLGIEKKFLDVYASSVAIPAPTDCAGGEMQPEGGCTNCLSVPAQGDGEQQRDGKQITMKSIFVTGCVSHTPAANQNDALTGPIVFVALVMDTQTNGATIVSENVFTNPNDTAVVNAFPLRNLENSARYRVLAHKTLRCEPVAVMTDGANTSSQMPAPVSFQLSFVGDVKMNFSSTTADVANAKDNSLHLIAFSNTANFSSFLSYNSRMRFVG